MIFRKGIQTIALTKAVAIRPQKTFFSSIAKFQFTKFVVIFVRLKKFLL